MSALTRPERRALRARGHKLRPVVHVGQAGIHAALLAKLEDDLFAHELVKVKLGQGAPLETRAAAAELSEATGAEVVQTIGGMVLLYKERPDAPAP